MNSPKNIFSATVLAEKFSQFTGSTIYVTAGSFCSNSSPYEQESALMNSAVTARKLEFYSGRHYAHQALKQLNLTAQPLLRGEKGNPLWPPGIKGSITHDMQQVIVAVTNERNITGLGIDLIIKPESVEPQLQQLIASEEDLHTIKLACPTMPPLALAFSFKESVVKAVSPTINYYLDLLEINFSIENGFLIAKLPIVDTRIKLRCHFLKLKYGFVTISTFNISK